jgi:hypothetical protein
LTLYRVFLIASLILQVSCPIFAQDQSSGISTHASHYLLSGVVLDPSGAAIPKARVMLLGGGPEALAETVTDFSGAFHFDQVSPGKYSLDFHAEGFRDTQLSTVVGSRHLSPLRITLQILVQAESVTVASGEGVPLINTEPQGNQNTNSIDRNALDRVPVFDQDYITTMSRFLDDNATGTNGVTLVVNGIEANGPGVTPSAV